MSQPHQVIKHGHTKPESGLEHLNLGLHRGIGIAKLVPGTGLVQERHVTARHVLKQRDGSRASCGVSEDRGRRLERRPRLPRTGQFRRPQLRRTCRCGELSGPRLEEVFGDRVHEGLLGASSIRHLSGKSVESWGNVLIEKPWRLSFLESLSRTEVRKEPMDGLS
jgi:hypothetical protein